MADVVGVTLRITDVPTPSPLLGRGLLLGLSTVSYLDLSTEPGGGTLRSGIPRPRRWRRLSGFSVCIISVCERVLEETKPVRSTSTIEGRPVSEGETTQHSEPSTITMPVKVTGPGERRDASGARVSVRVLQTTRVSLGFRV